MADGGAVALRLDQRLAHALHRFQPGSVGEVFVGLPAFLQIGQLGIGQNELLGKLDGLRADLVGDPAERRFHRHAGLDADQQQIERVRPGHLDRLLALGSAIADVQHRCVKARISDHNTDEQLDEGRLLGETVHEEDIDRRQREEDERQHQAEEQEPGQRILAAEARHLQLGQRTFVDERPTQIQPLDDGAHAGRLLFAQALATPVGLRGKTGALLGAELVALEGDGLHAGLERVAAERGQQREDRREDGNADQQRDHEDRIGDRVHDLIGHRITPRNSSSCASRICRSTSTPARNR